MHFGALVAAATPGGTAADLTILSSTLLTLAGLLFVVYVVAVVAGVTWGMVRGPQERHREQRQVRG